MNRKTHHETLSNRTLDQMKSLTKRFCHIDGLPFKKFFSAIEFAEMLENISPHDINKIYPPLVTLSAFISQVLSSDGSCRDAVARVNAERSSQGEKACSADNSPYCRARQRLELQGLQKLMTGVGMCLEKNGDPAWKWNGRSVKLVDGTTITMPDTPKNQKVYPQPESQKPGLGFPIARMVAVISLATGALIDCATARYAGKQTGEHALLRSIINCFVPGDIMLADCYYCSYFLIAQLRSMGVDAVFQQHGSRASDFRRGNRLGHKDHLVIWAKPACPDWMDAETYLCMPDTLTVREFKSGGIIIVTTMLDPKEAPRKEMAEFYTQRWIVEVDLRSIKQTLQMDMLRCKTPEMIHKEIAVHFIAYNLIRTVMAQAADLKGISPRTISFKGTVQTLNANRLATRLVSEAILPTLIEDLLNAVATHKVGNRPGRSEPRAVKRRPKSHPLLTVPRSQAA